MKSMFKGKLMGFLAMLFTSLVVLNIYTLSSYTTVSLPRFNELISEGEVTSVTLGDEDTFTFETKDGTVLKSYNPKTEAFRAELLNQEIAVKTPTSLLGYIGKLFLVLFAFSFIKSFIKALSLKNSLKDNNLKNAQMQGINGKDIKNLDQAASQLPSLAEVAGCDETKKDLAVIVDFLKSPQKYKEAGAKLPKGVLLEGPPGTGKTLLAKAIAGEAGVNFLAISGSDFDEKYVGVGASRVRELFKTAREKAPAIIFIDEIDAVGMSRNSNSSDKNQTINALLTELDGFNGCENVVVIAATNRAKDLDSALTRPGRFDRTFSVPLPDKKGRLDILKVHSKTKKIAESVSIDKIAAMTTGFSGAGLASLLNEASIHAVSKGRQALDMKDIDEAFFKIVMKGNKREVQDKNKKDLEITAWHEAGHVILQKMKCHTDVTKVSIISTTSGAGGVTIFQDNDKTYLTKESIKNNIMSLYAGRAAEEILLGKDFVTSGASNDIERATSQIKYYITSVGMDDEIGMLNLDVLMGQSHMSTYSNDDILKKASTLSKELYQETIDFLRKEKPLLESLAYALIEKEELMIEEIEEIFDEHCAQLQ